MTRFDNVFFFVFRQLKEEEEELIRPKQPAFDRSVKPSSDNLVRFPQIHRNFEPVYGTYGDAGATGLKNLGNTCYMNSIIQCVLNLESFCEYLRKDGYLKHVNRYESDYFPSLFIPMCRTFLTVSTNLFQSISAGRVKRME